MKLLIDADGCPVVDIAVRLAKKHGAQCLILCDTAHEISREGAETLTFAKGADSVDFALAARTQKGDVVVTQDYGLAAMCLAKGAFCMNQNGLEYTAQNIDGLLAERHNARKVRMTGGRMKGLKKRTNAHNSAFEAALDGLLGRACGQKPLWQ